MGEQNFVARTLLWDGLWDGPKSPRLRGETLRNASLADGRSRQTRRIPQKTKAPVGRENRLGAVPEIAFAARLGPGRDLSLDHKVLSHTIRCPGGGRVRGHEVSAPMEDKGCLEVLS